MSQGFTFGGPGGRIDSEFLTVDGMQRTTTYGYDSNGLLNRVTYPNGRVVGYGIDALNRINEVTTGGAVLAQVGYDDWGNRTSLRFASGAKSEWIPDRFGLHLQTWNITCAGGSDSRSYQFDPSDHLQVAGEWTLQHDSLGRLTGASGFGFMTAHGYDGFGNNITHTATGSVPGTFNQFGFNVMVDNRIPGNQANNGTTGWLIADNGEASQMGTQVSGTRFLHFGWDPLGRLSTVQDSQTGAVQTYRYAPSGLRVGLSDTSDSSLNRAFLYSTGGLLLEEFIGTGAWKRDVIYLGSQAVAEVDGDGVHELHPDHLGTPRAITRGSDGALEGRQAFGAFGEWIGASPATSGYLPLTGYTGHLQTEATGLIYMRGRYYSPAWHRFISSDGGQDKASWNQFAYVGGGPFHNLDPSGMAEVRFITMDNGTKMVDGGAIAVEVTGTPEFLNGADVPGYPTDFTDPIPGFGNSEGKGSSGQSQASAAMPQTPKPTKNCVGNARIREGNRSFQANNKAGAFGIGVSNGLAIIRSQWGWSSKSQMRPYLNSISGTLADGTSLFNRITDIQDNRAFGNTQQAQDRIIKESGGNLVLEIYGQRDLGVQSVIITVPSKLDCPQGTQEAK